MGQRGRPRLLEKSEHIGRNRRRAKKVFPRLFHVTGLTVHEHGGISQVALDGHPRRCQSTNKYGEQCKRYASHNWHLCDSHSKKDRIRMGTNVYTRAASISFKDLLKRVATDDPSELMSLASEVEVSRLVCSEAIRIFDGILCAESQGIAIKPVHKVAALEGIKEGVKHVSDTVSTYAKVLAISARTLSPEQFDFLLKSIIRVVEKTLMPAHEDLYIQITKDLEKLETPKKSDFAVQINLT